MIKALVNKVRNKRREYLNEKINQERLVLEKERFDRILCHITKEQIGLEIGPSLRPCAPKKDGYQVEIIDHLDKNQLIQKYECMGLDVSAIEEVDYIWDGRTYSEITGKENYYDYIIASHVIEHTSDFIGFLQDCSRMLKVNGILSLAVPDKRYTLDHFRMVTTTGKIIDDHLDVLKLGSIGTLMDYGMHVVRRSGLTSWSKQDVPNIEKEYELVYEKEELKNIYQNTINARCFHDIHQYVFTPSSFKLLIKELLEYDFIDLDIDNAYDTKTEEFIVSMRKVTEKKLLTAEEHMKLIREVSLENVVID